MYSCCYWANFLKTCALDWFLSGSVENFLPEKSVSRDPTFVAFLARESDSNYESTSICSWSAWDFIQLAQCNYPSTITKLYPLIRNFLPSISLRKNFVFINLSLTISNLELNNLYYSCGAKLVLNDAWFSNLWWPAY